MSRNNKSHYQVPNKKYSYQRPIIICILQVLYQTDFKLYFFETETYLKVIECRGFSYLYKQKSTIISSFVYYFY